MNITIPTGQHKGGFYNNHETRSQKFALTIIRFCGLL